MRIDGRLGPVGTPSIAVVDDDRVAHHSPHIHDYRVHPQWSVAPRAVTEPVLHQFRLQFLKGSAMKQQDGPPPQAYAVEGL